MNNITREEAIKEAGLAVVEKVESESVDFTSRVTDGTHHAGWTEFSASVGFTDRDGLDSTLTMFVFVPHEEVQEVEELDWINWEEYISEAEFRIS